MSDLVRTIIKWVLFIAIVILVIFIIVKVANKADSTETESTNPGVRVVDETSRYNTDEDTNTTDESTTMVVNSPDTATRGDFINILGILITASGFYYVYKNKKVTE